MKNMGYGIRDSVKAAAAVLCLVNAALLAILLMSAFDLGGVRVHVTGLDKAFCLTACWQDCKIERNTAGHGSGGNGRDGPCFPLSCALNGTRTGTALPRCIR